MKIGVQFDGFASLGAMVEAARAAERAGASSLWFAQHMGYREAFASAMAAACHTSRATIVPLAITPYLTPPLMAAMSIASIAELAVGRTELSISVGNLMDLRQSGFVVEKPLNIMREYMISLRKLLAGEAVSTETGAHQLSAAHMEFAHGLHMPIHLASTGPQMLKLGGEMADGVVLSTGLTMASMRQCLAQVEIGARKAGREPKSVKRIGLAFLCVSEDGRQAKQILRRKLAYLFRSPGHAANIESAALGIDHAAIMACNARRDLDAATALIPEDAGLVFGAAGTPEECRRRLHDYMEVGLDELVLVITGDEQMNLLALQVITAVVESEVPA